MDTRIARSGSVAMARSGTGAVAAKLAAIGNDGWPNVLPIEALGRPDRDRRQRE